MTHHIGFIGLGKMGKNMVLRLREKGIEVVAYNRTPQKEIEAVTSIEALIKELPTPRVIWLMVPNGQPVDDVIGQLMSFGIQKGDIVIDGGNTYYKDTVRRNREFAAKGIIYLDCGTSGGLEGARNGACLMIGGDESVVHDLTWLWDAAAVKDGWAHFGPSGAGHFVKMVHNGVEYGMNQAIGEGFEILSKGPYTLDFAKVAHNWSHGSVVRGWLIELLAKAMDDDPKLDGFSGRVGGGETGKWTTDCAIEFNVEAPVITDALKARKESMEKPTFAGKVVSALRAGYGGHTEPK
jgi:6-phosphogluconate dehydrogenase